MRLETFARAMPVTPGRVPTRTAIEAWLAQADIRPVRWAIVAVTAEALVIEGAHWRA